MAVPVPDTARTSARDRRHALECLRASAWVVAVGGGVVALKVITGHGVACPFHLFTGLYCPLCGSTRLAVDLLHGDVAGAFRNNQVAFCGALVALVAVVVWIVEILGGPSIRLRWLTGARAQKGAVAIALVWGVVRNLVPGLTPLA